MRKQKICIVSHKSKRLLVKNSKLKKRRILKSSGLISTFLSQGWHVVDENAFEFEIGKYYRVEH